MVIDICNLDSGSTCACHAPSSLASTTRRYFSTFSRSKLPTAT
uniref:Uncharacterized protein n=1 Tax=Anguilla anguilla TaxID=7936 RepID=A0A0E9PK05_ANGAN